MRRSSKRFVNYDIGNQEYKRFRTSLKAYYPFFCTLAGFAASDENQKKNEAEGDIRDGG